MNESYFLAGKGLRTMFIAQIIGIVSMFIPVIGVLGVLAGGILSLIGLNTAAKAHDGFRTAMTAVLVGIVISVVEAFLPEGSMVAMLVSLIGGIVSLIGLYFVCNTAAGMVEERGDYELAQKGQFVWKLNLVCIIVVVVCTLVVFIPFLGIFVAIAAIGAAIASLVGAILYIVFLYKASDCLSR